MSNLRNPCKGCRYRHIGCHEHCFLYKEWKTQTSIINELMRKDKETDDALTHHKKFRKR